MPKPKLIRITTVPSSLKILMKGQHRFMSSFYEVVGISSAGPELNEVAENEGIRVQQIEMTRKISPLKDLRSTYALYRLLRKEKPWIVHTHTPKAGIVGMLAAKLASVPHRLHTVAGMPLMETQGFKRRLLLFVERLTYRLATKVYPNSKGLKEFILRQKLCKPHKLKVIANGSSNGIDTDYFDPANISEEIKTETRKKYRIQEKDLVFVFVGRLVGDKGLNELVQAFDELSTNDQHLKLLLLGEAEPDLDPLAPETIATLKVHSNIVSVGFQQDIRPFLSISQILVFPSYREGFPNVVMQAGAMGLPSIVSDINGCNEIIVEGVNGHIIPPKDRAALKEKMLTYSNNSNVFSAEKCREMITSRYKNTLVWKELLAEYQDLK